MALRCFGWVVAHASVVMRWHGTGELGGPTGAIVLSPDVAGGVLPVDLWTTRLRCPQIHRHRDHNSKAIFHLVALNPIAPCPPQIARSPVKLRPASTPTGRPAKHPVPNRPPCSAAEMLETQRWRRITWRTGTKGPLNARFAAVRVRVADGPLNAEDTRLPGAELWLIGEWRDSGEKKYDLSSRRSGPRCGGW